MGFARAAASRLMSTGVLSAGWYSILTGLALLYVAYALGSVSGDEAAPFVAIALAVTGAWQLERGVRAEFQRRPKSTDEAS
jgi:glycerol uptake facilitator-like aquaporin